MERHTWEVEYLTPPKTLKHCKKCSTDTEYVSSGLFRVNANQKMLDIWLIYRCSHCKSTWNLAIYSRIHTKKVEPSLLKRLTNNDSELAHQYAMDIDFLKRNGATIEMPEYRIIGDDTILSDSKGTILLTIKTRHGFPIKVSKIIQKKLSLSKKEYKNIVQSGAIQTLTGQDLHRCKLMNGIELIINTDKL